MRSVIFFPNLLGGGTINFQSGKHTKNTKKYRNNTTNSKTQENIHSLTGVDLTQNNDQIKLLRLLT